MNRTKDIQSQSTVMSRWTHYFNGPEGRLVLENLEEGESLILQTSDHSVRVTKRNGHAVVVLISQLNSAT